jgi:hypothetical protein
MVSTLKKPGFLRSFPSSNGEVTGITGQSCDPSCHEAACWRLPQLQPPPGPGQVSCGARIPVHSEEPELLWIVILYHYTIPPRYASLLGNMMININKQFFGGPQIISQRYLGRQGQWLSFHRVSSNWVALEPPPEQDKLYIYVYIYMYHIVCILHKSHYIDQLDHISVYTHQMFLDQPHHSHINISHSMIANRITYSIPIPIRYIRIVFHLMPTRYMIISTNLI